MTDKPLSKSNPGNPADSRNNLNSHSQPADSSLPPPNPVKEEPGAAVGNDDIEKIIDPPVKSGGMIGEG